jgi:UDP-GlcNAc:undecaprenyl-phosphate GlcNAc-1-phosphate transferase
MLNSLITLALSTSVAIITAFLLLNRGAHLVPHDKPGGRKQHVSATPLIGGLIIFAGLLPLAVIMPQAHTTMPFLALAGATVLLGMMDDQHELSAGLRLAAHLLVGLGMVLWADISLTNLGHLFGTEPLMLGWLAIPLTCFAIAASMNAVNMVDGVDGLAGALCLLPILVVSAFALHAGESALTLKTVAVAGGLFVFLLFNFPFPWRDKASCFLGDTGSTLLGLMVAWFLIAGAELGLYRPVLALLLLAIPLVDTAGVMLRRVLRGVSMSTPGRDHLHHVFIDSGMPARHATIIIVAIALLIASVGIVLELRDAPEWVVLLIFVLCLLANLVFLRSAERAKQMLRERWFT